MPKTDRSLSREMNLSLNGETFSELKEDINNYLQMTLSKMDEKSSTEAEITVKITISLDHTKIPVLDEEGEDSHRDAKLPSFKHKVSSLMKTKFETSGDLDLAGDYELVFDEKREEYIMRKLVDPQTSLYDTD